MSTIGHERNHTPTSPFPKPFRATFPKPASYTSLLHLLNQPPKPASYTSAKQVSETGQRNNREMAQWHRAEEQQEKQEKQEKPQHRNTTAVYISQCISHGRVVAALSCGHARQSHTVPQDRVHETYVTQADLHYHCVGVLTRRVQTKSAALSCSMRPRRQTVGRCDKCRVSTLARFAG